MKKYVSFVIACLSMMIGVAEPARGTWPLPSAEPWSNVILSPHDQITDLFTSVVQPIGDILLGGNEGDPVVAIESGVISFSSYHYSPTWRTSFGGSDLAALTKEIMAMPGADQKAINIIICITNSTGARVWYAGLAPDQPLPKTGLKLEAGQVIGRLGHAYPNLPPNVSIQGANWAGTNRILVLLGSPYPPLVIQKPKSRSDRVTRALLLKDVDVFWNALTSYYPGLYDQTSQISLEASLSDFRKAIPSDGLTIGEFANRLRTFMHLFSDNHMSLWETYNPEDAVYLPVEIGAIDGKLFIVSSQVKALPVGARITTLDGTPAERVIDFVWTQVGRSDGNLGNWERESLSRNAGRFWVNTSAHRAGDKIGIVLSDGSKTTVALGKLPVSGQTDWWARTDKVTKSRGTRIPGFEDTANIVIRRISPDIDAITLYSFDWTDVEKDEIDRYFSADQNQLPANIILDLRNNPGGEELTQWNFDGYFIKQELRPFEYKTVLQKKISTDGGAGNFIDGDDKTFGDYVLRDNGTWRANPKPTEIITARKNPSFNGRLIILTSGTTGSAAFDSARLLKAGAQAILIGRPGPHGTNRMIAEKFAQVYLPTSGVNLGIPMVKMVTEKDGEAGPAKQLSIDYPVEISLDAVLGKNDPEWDLALKIIGSSK